MSYDLNFWKQSKRLKSTPEAIYTKLSAGKRVRGIGTLPVDDILAELPDVLPGFTPGGDLHVVFGDDASVDVTWSDQHFRFDVYGGVPDALTRQLVELFMPHGCALYDPALDKHHVGLDGFSPVKPRAPKQAPMNVLRFIQRSAQDLGWTLLPPPAAVRLRPATEEDFHPAPMLRNTRQDWSRDARDLGYAHLGDFVADEPKTVVVAYQHPETRLLALNYEHHTGIGWDEVVALHPDQTRHVWSSEIIDRHNLSWITRTIVFGGIKELDRTARQALPGLDTAVALEPDALKDHLESEYERELAWRAAR